MRKLSKIINYELKQELIKWLNLEAREEREIYAIIRHVSQSGMTRYISFMNIDNGKRSSKPYMDDITQMIGKILGLSYSEKHRALKVQGCGMDMAFHTIYNLSSELYGDGYRLHSKII